MIQRNIHEDSEVVLYTFLQDLQIIASFQDRDEPALSGFHSICSDMPVAYREIKKLMNAMAIKQIPHSNGCFSSFSTTGPAVLNKYRPIPI